MTRLWPDGEPARRLLDEEPLDADVPDDDVERCWGYEIPVRHRLRRREQEPTP